MPPRSERASHVGERDHVHDRGPQLGERAFGEIGVLGVRHIGHDEPEHGIAQELQALVRDLGAVLERVRAVRERGRPERGVVERHAEGAVQGLERRLDGNGGSRRYSTSTA